MLAFDGAELAPELVEVAVEDVVWDTPGVPVVLELDGT